MATTLAPPPARAAAVTEPTTRRRSLCRRAALAALLAVTAVLYLWDLPRAATRTPSTPRPHRPYDLTDPIQ